MDCIHAGIDDSRGAVTPQTSAKHAGAFRKFQMFLQECGIQDDPFLDAFQANQKTLILTGFAYSVRTNQNGRTNRPTLHGSTVGSTIGDLVQAFRQNLRPDPTLDVSGLKAQILTRQIKAYTNKDPPTQHQACLPLVVWKAIAADDNTKQNEAIGQLIVGALFFAMRSCEFSTTSGAEQKRTKLLTVENIRFFDKNAAGLIQAISHSSTSPPPQDANCVAITFENQKNGEKDATITQHRTPEGRICPVRTWAAIVVRIINYPKATNKSTVNTFLASTGKLVRFTATQVKRHLVSSVNAIGPEKLGIDIKKVGTRSLRTSAAMLLYLANVRTSTIMLIGRWKSDAFLIYLRRQVKEFTEGVTQQMTSQPDSFFTIPEMITEDLPQRQVAAREDPMTSNPNSAASSARFNGLATSSNTSHVNSAHATRFNTWG